MLKIFTPEEVAREQEEIQRAIGILRVCIELESLERGEKQKRKREIIVSNGQEYLNEALSSKKYLEEANGNIELAAELMMPVQKGEVIEIPKSKYGMDMREFLKKCPN